SNGKENKKPLSSQPQRAKPVTGQKRKIEGMLSFKLGSESSKRSKSSEKSESSKRSKSVVFSDESSITQSRLPASTPVLMQDTLHVEMPFEIENSIDEPKNFTENAKWQTCFTPQQKCVDFLTAFLSKAKKSIYLQAYVLSSQQIADELVTAHNRGVEVKVLVDNSQMDVSYSKISFLSRNGVFVYIDIDATLAHNKVIVIDKEVTITGSYNFSAAADKSNIENLIVIKDPKVARSYLDNYITRYKNCLRYDNKADSIWIQLLKSPTRKKSISRMMSDSDFYQVDAY
ncbi:MAG: phospholipase D family protein, partial [Alphaproteobacteria bacterium]|nr:phospholipase D family protein [Alphaproteobacteria bacterium]